MTKLDEKLQEIAVKDWDKFVKLVGEDSVINAKTCLLRQDQHSYGQICNMLSLTPKEVRVAASKCDC